MLEELGDPEGATRSRTTVLEAALREAMSLVGEGTVHAKRWRALLANE